MNDTTNIWNLIGIFGSILNILYVLKWIFYIYLSTNVHFYIDITQTICCSTDTQVVCNDDMYQVLLIHCLSQVIAYGLS